MSKIVPTWAICNDGSSSTRSTNKFTCIEKKKRRQEKQKKKLAYFPLSSSFLFCFLKISNQRNEKEKKKKWEGRAEMVSERTGERMWPSQAVRIAGPKSHRPIPPAFPPCNTSPTRVTICVCTIRTRACPIVSLFLGYF